MTILFELFDSQIDHYRAMSCIKQCLQAVVRSYPCPFHHPITPSPSSFFNLLLHVKNISSSSQSQSPNASPEHVNEICRLLSDYRSPNHDIESALHPFSPLITTDLVEQVLKRCKNLDFSAHRFFLWSRKLPGFIHSRDTHHILVDILGTTKRFPLIWDFLSEIRDGNDHEITPDIFWIIFRSYCRADLPMDAIRAFEKMPDFGLKPAIDDLDKLLIMLCKKNMVEHAQEFFDKVKLQFPPSPKTYSILMRGWGEVGGDSLHARKLFDEILQRGCSVDLVAFNTLLESMCRGGKADESYKLFKEMGFYGLKPDASTYSVFIRAACELHDVHSAVKVLDRTRRYNLVPNVFTYNCVLRLLVKNQMLDDAYLLLDEMIDRGASPDIWTYNAIQSFHCDHSQVTKALRLISRMEKDGCMPDRHTYNMVLKMLIRVGRFDRATALWESMGDKGYYPPVSTYAVMIHSLCKKKGKIEDACHYFELMIDEGLPPYPCTCELLRERLLGIGFMDKTQILANKMLQSTSCSIQELSKIMAGEKICKAPTGEEEKPIWYEDGGYSI